MKYELLGKAIAIAVAAHEGQFDKGGKPYILHPLHLMTQLMYDVELAQIAVLHDVIEDSDVNLDDLFKLGFSHRVRVALKLLTHYRTDSYEDYIAGIATNIDAIRVKRKDLEHNSDITRLMHEAGERDMLRVAKYQRAFVLLGKARSDFV